MRITTSQSVPDRHSAARQAARQSRSGRGTDAAQWLAYAAVALISLTLIALIWTLTARAINEEAMELQAQTDQHLRSVAFVLAREIEGELLLVDQSLAIIQDAWNKDAGAVDLAAWRRQLRALTEVASDIFIANEHGIIVQGTLPQSIGQGFGSAYVTMPNGSLESFGPDGKPDPNGASQGEDGVQARQYLTYILRPLQRPDGWMIGASYRSQGITKLFAGARLGSHGIIALVALKRGGLQAISGPAAQLARMDIASSALIEQIRHNDAGIWAGDSPIDGVAGILAYQHIPGRDMAVLVGVSAQNANAPLSGLAATARGLAALGSLIVLIIAGIVVWTLATARAARQRQRVRERLEIDLSTARQEVALARTQALLSAAEVDALLGSVSGGVACLDPGQQLQTWNECFAALSGVTVAGGQPAEALFRAQAAAGRFGEPTAAEAAVGKRLMLLQSATGSGEPERQLGPDGAVLSMAVRGVAGGGHVLLLTAADATGCTGPPGDEADGEVTDW